MNYIKRYEKKYMYRICESQIKNMTLIIFSCLVYGLIGYFWISETAFTDFILAKRLYAFFLAITAFMLLYLLIGQFFIKGKDARYHFCNLGMILTTQLYLIWSNKTVGLLFHDFEHVDMLPWLMVYAVTVTCFFYRFLYFVIISVCNICLIIIYNSRMHASHIETSYVFLGVFVILLVYIYVVKHFKELRDFEQRLEYEKNVETNKLFTASMNHELRTPLNSIVGNAQIMLSDSSLSQNSREITETIFNSSKVMVQLVNDLLDYSKMDAGEFKIIKAEFNLLVLRDNIYSMLLQLAREKGLDFDVMVEEGTTLQMVGDMRRIQQIAINIISNSIKYTKSGSVKAHFSVQNDKLRIFFIDTGVGMSKDSIDDLFTPYKRINEDKNIAIQGTGLGMFVVKMLLDQMNGSINVDSVLGVGTNMTVDIPVTTIKGSKVYRKNMTVTQNEATTEEEKQYDFTGKVILTVDDTVINNKIVQNILESVGATTFCSLDGENCLKFLESHHVDLVLLDHIMPGMDGVECLSRIRDSGKSYQDIPVIMLSGNTDKESLKLYQDIKADGALSKPIMVDELFEKIDQLLYK